MPLPMLFLAAMVGFFMLYFVLDNRRHVKQRGAENALEHEPVVFAAQVRARTKGSYSLGYGSLKSGGAGITLRIHRSVLVVGVNPPFQGVADALGAEIVLIISETTMTRRRIGWVGSPVFAKDSILLFGNRGGTPVKIAIDPLGNLAAVWDALRAAGVTAGPN